MKRLAWALVGVLLVLSGAPGTPIAGGPRRLLAPSFVTQFLMGPPLSATYIPTPYRSIQQGFATIAVGNLTQSVVITSVDTTVAIVTATPISAQTSSGTLANGDLCRVVIADATHLTVTRDALTGSSSSDAGCSVTWTVYEYIKQFVKTRQAAVTTIASTAATQALSPSVTVAKAACAFAGMSEASAGVEPGQSFGGCYVSATNAVTLKVGAFGSGTLKVAWTVLETW